MAAIEPSVATLILAGDEAEESVREPETTTPASMVKTAELFTSISSLSSTTSTRS